MDFKIESGILAPENKKKTFSLYPFSDMKAGESIAVPIGIYGRARAAAYTFGNRNGMKFTCRKLSPDSARIWRTK